jgi:tape measure domain-containing protein
MALRQDEIVISYKVEGAASIDNARFAFDKLTQAEKDAIEQAKKLGKETEKATKETKNNVDKAKQSVSLFGDELKQLQSKIIQAFSIAAIVGFGRELLKVSAAMEQYDKRIAFVAGSLQKGAVITAQLTELSRRYALDLKTIIETYSSFSKSASLANLSAIETMDIFKGVSSAVAGFGLSAQQAESVFLALGQMLDKSTVQSQELKQQLGNALPGAFGFAVKAAQKMTGNLKLTTTEFTKMLETGQIISRDFLPEFGKVLDETFSVEAGKNVDTLGGAFQTLATEINIAMNKASWFKKVISDVVDVLRFYNKATRDEKQLRADALAQMTTWYTSKMKEKKTVEELNEEYSKVKTELEGVNTEIKKQQDGFDNINVEAFTKRVKKLSFEQSVLIMKMDVVNQLKAQFDAPPPATESDADRIKRLTKEYQALIAELQRQEGIQIRLKNLSLGLEASPEEVVQNENEVLRIQQHFANLKLGASKKFGKLNVDQAQKDQEIFVLDANEANKEVLKNTVDFKNEELKEIKDRYENLKKEDADYLKFKKEQAAEIEKLTAQTNEEHKKIDEKAAKEKKERDKKNKDDDIKEAGETNQRITDENMLYLQESLQLAQTVFNGFMNLRQQALAAELSASQRLFDEQLRMFEGNEEMQAMARDRFRVKERELKKKAFIADKQAAIANAIFQATPNIIKLATNPVTAPAAIIAGAALTAQIGFIAAQPMPEFAKGTEYVEGAGTGTSDSIMARLSKGERVMTARQNKPLLDMGIKNDDIPKIVLDYMSLTSGRTKGSNSRGIERKLDDLNRSIKSLPVAAISLDGKGFSKSIRSGNRTSVILNNQFVN